MTNKSEDWVTPKGELRLSPIGGRGLFALEPIFEGEEVIRWGGPFVKKEEALKARAAGKLVLQFDEDLFSVEDRGESSAYFVNHSCDPNLWMRGAFVLEARRDIAPGEELTADYIIWTADEAYVSSWQCRCGAESCRGHVTGSDWKRQELQERYRDHFIPLLNARIATRTPCEQ